MKAPSKSVELKLARLTREFFALHPGIKLIAVTGSAGKASAKVAIGTVVAQTMSVQLREEEPKTKSDVFLQIMGVQVPTSGLFRWARVIHAVKKRVKTQNPEAQVIIQEFNPQELGYNAWFREYLLPDIAVVTSVSSGRMQVDHSVEDVANEMITLANNSKLAMINRDDVEGRFAGFLTNPNITTYGTSSVAEYSYDESHFSLDSGHEGNILSPENPNGLAVNVKLLGEHNIRPAIAAAAVAYKLGIDEPTIAKGLAQLTALPGRMNMLKGADGSWLIDDSYSSSPQTALSALQALYALEAPQRIAVLGNMNGLRIMSEQAHADLGSQCRGDMLDWVVTVGDKANAHLAPAARQQGCQVKECVDAIEAGGFVREKLAESGIALFKGSSGGVWLEEAIKINLSSTGDESRLARQEPYWLERKQEFFTANRLGGERLDKYNKTYRKK